MITVNAAGYVGQACHFTTGGSQAMDFDSRARTWDADPLKQERALAVAAAIRQRIPLSRAWRALDYGCGTGLLGFALRDDVGEVTLADSSPGMLTVLGEKIAAANARNLHARQLDLTCDSLPGERYELICTLMTLHHVVDVDRLLRTFHELLRAGGWLAIADLDREDGSFHGAGFTGHPGFERTALHAQLIAAGFSRADFSTCYVVKKSTDQGSVDYPLFLAAATRS